MASLDYFGECCEKFEKMPMRGEIDLKTQVKPENLENFIETVKLHIDVDMGRKEGFYLEPNNDWTIIRKKPL